MSFFSPSQYEPQVRQKGFNLPSPVPASPPPSHHDLFAVGMNQHHHPPQHHHHHSYIADPFRKFPAADSAAAAAAALDFSDELASLIDRPNSASHHHPNNTNSNTRATTATAAYDDSAYHRPHNIFDISAPTTTQHQPQSHQNQQQPQPLPSSASSTASAFPHDPPPGFNSTLPALNSSMRYEPHPDPPTTQGHDQGQQHPPSSFPSGHFNRQSTPSPIHHQSGRSRSRSRPGSSGGGVSGAPTGGPGPARTTRTRRNNSVSSTSPPPHGARPQAIVIPGSHHTHHRMAASLGGGIGTGNIGSPLGGAGQGWFMNSHSSASDFSLPTPDSLHSHAHSLHSHSHSQHSHSHSHSHSHQGYTPFSLSSPTDMHLPPLSHSLSHGPHAIPQLVGAASAPKDPPHGHLSLSSSIGSNTTIVNGINGLGLGMSPPHSHAVVGTPQGAQAVSVVSQAQSAAEKQAAIANEKRRRRRESHNAVERRRRDNINEKITELATLIPECMLDVSNTSNAPNLDDQLLSPISPSETVPVLKKEDDGGTPTGAAGEGGVVKANKGMILRKSVEYIRYLQQLVTAQGSRNRELEQELKAYRSGNPPPPPSMTSSDPASSHSPEANTGLHESVISGAPDDMVLATEAAAAATDDSVMTSGGGGGGGGFGGFTLPPPIEDDEMTGEPAMGHTRGGGSTNELELGDSEGSLSPVASVVEGNEMMSEERGRTRDIAGGRRVGLNGNAGEGIMVGLSAGGGGLQMVAMET